MNASKMKWFSLEIRDCEEAETVYFKGHNAAHAEERFIDSMMDNGGMEGVEVLSVKRYRSEREKISAKYRKNSVTL